MDLHITDEMQVELPPAGSHMSRTPNDTLVMMSDRAPTLDPHSQEDMGNLPRGFVRVGLPAYLGRGRRALLCSQEVVTLDPDTIGLICLRSTWARLGLIAPPTVADPGFHGQLTMEVCNLSTCDLYMRPGDAIWSMSRLQLVLGSEPIYQGRYQGQRGIQFPKVLEKGG